MPKGDLGDVPYQQAGQVRQLLAERGNAEALGLTDRVAAADKQLAELGYARPEAAPEVSRTSAPVGRTSKQDRAEKTDAAPADEPAKPATPAGRTSARKSTT